jgi:hypothetical protein
MKRFPPQSIVTIVCFVVSCCCAAFASHAKRATITEFASTSASADEASPSSQFSIPGPLRSFLRMAGISQEIPPGDVLPLLSWSVSTIGYQSNHPTEYLILLTRYVAQARELAALAGKEGVLRVSSCEDAGPLLHILGYRIASTCGQPDVSLITMEAERAFLTIDSGFPVTELEQALQESKPFEYPFSSTDVPVLFSEADWTNFEKKKNHGAEQTRIVDEILADRSVARLYWALSKIDPETRLYLRRTYGIKNLLEYGPVLDFYGSHLCVRNGHVLVPGGTEAESAWEELVGVSPRNARDFIPTLLAKDNGWLAAYFDSLLSVNGGARQSYFTASPRLQRFYAALRGTKPASATRGVFRPAPWLLLLISEIPWAQDGEPLVPGGIEVWRRMLLQWKDFSHVDRDLGKRHIKTADDLIEDMFAMARQGDEDGPLQAYLALSQVSSRRPDGHGLSPETVRSMCVNFADFRDQYRIFSEFPELSDASILQFLKFAGDLDKLPKPQRNDALGIIQANIGIWQILARQGEIPKAQLDDSWQTILKPFERARTSIDLLEAGRASLGHLLSVASGNSAIVQDDIVELLAGPAQATPEGRKVHRELMDQIRSVLDAQRLISLDTLIALDDGLKDKSKGKQPAEYLFHLADELREFQMPQRIFSNSERTQWAPTFYNTHHTDLEMKANVTQVLKSTRPSPGQVDEARSELTPFLRDILVGLNYAYYEPPGAQALHANPLFVRSHDFSGETVEGIKAVWQTPQLFGAGATAGGGAHFVGSLADLPYVLAELEQDFIVPKNVQALIWEELVPSLLVSSVLPRWWNVSPAELHAVALYQRSGEELITASAKDARLRAQVIAILSERMLRRRVESVEQGIMNGRISQVLAEITPADTFYLCGDFYQKYSGEAGSFGSAGEELLKLQHQYPDEVSWARLSHDFGTPHPTLSYSYTTELLNVPPMPALSGFASRLLAESWESSNLYWARLADEKGYSPVALNLLVPELTQQMIARIFATDFEDWPAILRAMRRTGEDFRDGRILSLTHSTELRHLNLNPDVERSVQHSTANRNLP